MAYFVISWSLKPMWRKLQDSVIHKDSIPFKVHREIKVRYAFWNGLYNR